MKEDEAKQDQNNPGPDSDSPSSVGEQECVSDQRNAECGTAKPQKNKGILARLREHPEDHVKMALIFDFILIVVTIIYASFAALQWYTLKRQANGIEAQVARMAESIEQTRTLIAQQKEALEYARTQADVARQALQDARRSAIPVIQMGGWDFKPPGINPGKITASISLANRGSADVTNATGQIVMEIRKDEPPLSYRPNWKITSDVTIQRNHGERSFEVSRTFSQSEVEEIWAERKFICVFGFLDYLDPLGNKIRKRFCIRFGSTARECETWQGQEGYPKQKRDF